MSHTLSYFYILLVVYSPLECFHNIVVIIQLRLHGYDRLHVHQRHTHIIYLYYNNTLCMMCVHVCMCVTLYIIYCGLVHVHNLFWYTATGPASPRPLHSTPPLSMKRRPVHPTELYPFRGPQPLTHALAHSTLNSLKNKENNISV